VIRFQVKIYILLWRDPALFTDNGSREVQKLLCQLHDNIKVATACIILSCQTV
jgi:hypothetical protein